MFKLQPPSKYSPFDTIHLLRCLSHCSKQLLNLTIVMPVSACAISCFISSTWAKHFPLRMFFIQGNNNKKITQGESRRIGSVGHGGHAIFGQKLLNTQHSVGRCTCKSPIMKWANVLKVFKTNSLKLSTTSHSNTNW